MFPIEIDDLTFAWPVEEDDVASASTKLPEAGDTDDDTAHREDAGPLFSHLSLKLPQGLTFLVGPNGIGKSTLMLLAGGRIFPDAGSVRVLGTDTGRYADAPFDPGLEMERNQLVSFVYQNMEFETEEPIDAVFDMVISGSRDSEAAATFREELVAAAGLHERLTARMQELSKGEMQRAIVVMSMLYGSPVVMMDEPVFAVEPDRAERLFTFLREHCRRRGVSVYASVHDVEMARRFADSIVLFDTDGTITVGEPDELLARERLERAFRAPYATLYERQHLYRSVLAKGVGS